MKKKYKTNICEIIIFMTCMNFLDVGFFGMGISVEISLSLRNASVSTALLLFNLIMALVTYSAVIMRRFFDCRFF